jgi:hypothetical protein
MAIETLLYYAVISVASLVALGLLSRSIHRWLRWRSFAHIYKRFPPHQNVGHLVDRIERLGDCFLDREARAISLFREVGIPGWEWQLGTDLKELVQIVRDHVPLENYSSYGFLASVAANQREEANAPRRWDAADRST